MSCAGWSTWGACLGASCGSDREVSPATPCLGFPSPMADKTWGRRGAVHGHHGPSDRGPLLVTVGNTARGEVRLSPQHPVLLHPGVVPSQQCCGQCHQALGRKGCPCAPCSILIASCPGPVCTPHPAQPRWAPRHFPSAAGMCRVSMWLPCLPWGFLPQESQDGAACPSHPRAGWLSLHSASGEPAARLVPRDLILLRARM